MRIGIDARLWSESGVGRYIRNLVQHLGKLDTKNRYFLFVLKQDYGNLKSQISNLKYENFKVVEADVQWHTIEEQIRLPSIIEKEKPDLVHFPYFSVPILYNKPFVITIHDLILHHFPTGQASTLPVPIYRLKLLGYKFVINQAAKKAKKIITVSNATKNEIVDHLKVDPEKVSVIYEGTTLASSSRKILTKRYTLEAKRYFLYIGNAYPHKNLERLLTAFATVRDEVLGIRLVFVGKEDYFYKRLKEKVKETNLGKSVVFLGEVSDEELTELYRNAEALVMPSLMEGFGLPAVEAMVNKCLVLASNIPSLWEVCGDVAVYFDPNSVEEIAQKLKDVIESSKDFDFKRVKGVERARQFSWKKMAEETLKIYEEAGRGK